MESEMISLWRLAADFSEMGEEAWRKSNSNPFLLVLNYPDPPASNLEIKTDKLSMDRFLSSAEQVQHSVLEITKSDRNPFASKILIGRAKNNDIILRSPKISKLHASLLCDASVWHIMDLGSMNGSELNEAKLTANKSYPLSSGDILSFSDFKFMFVDTIGLINILKERYSSP
jgi:hypothetical protein